MTEEERAAWLAERMNYVTASQIAALMGDSPYQDEEGLFEEKVFGRSEFFENKAMWWGSEMEVPNLVAFGKLTGLTVVTGQEFITKGDLSATLDARITNQLNEGRAPEWVTWPTGYLRIGLSVGDPPPVTGHWVAVADGKNCSEGSYSRFPKTGHRMPKYYWWQLQTQMHCSGLTEAVLVVKVGSADMVAIVTQYDAEAMERAAEKATEFMRKVRACR